MQAHNLNQIASSKQAGMTIIEIITVVAIGGILLVALLRFLVAGYPISKITLLQANSNETARIQLRRIARELRELRDADTGAYPLVEMKPQKIIFYADVDGDAATERVRYELTGTDLERGIIDPTGTPLTYNTVNEKKNIVAKSIRNGTTPIFRYYTGDYPTDMTELTPVDVTEVKYIQFLLQIDADINVDPPPIEVKSQVQLRNLKTNLSGTTE